MQYFLLYLSNIQLNLRHRYNRWEYHSHIEMSSLLTPPGIFLLRTYAIYGRSWIVFFLLAILGLGPFASGIVLLFLFSFTQDFADAFKVVDCCPNGNRTSCWTSDRYSQLCFYHFFFCKYWVCFHINYTRNITEPFYSMNILLLLRRLIISSQLI